MFWLSHKTTIRFWQAVISLFVQSQLVSLADRFYYLSAPSTTNSLCLVIDPSLIVPCWWNKLDVRFLYTHAHILTKHNCKYNNIETKMEKSSKISNIQKRVISIILKCIHHNRNNLRLDIEISCQIHTRFLLLLSHTKCVWHSYWHTIIPEYNYWLIKVIKGFSVTYKKSEYDSQLFSARNIFTFYTVSTLYMRKVANSLSQTL